MSINNRSFINYIFLFIFLVLAGREAQSQIAVNSPYSRYGVGDLATRQNAYNFSMGGVAFAISNPNFINPFNPAANHAYDSLSFVFTGGVASQLAELRNNEMTSNTNFITLGYLLFGFPVTKWFKMSFGINPYSNVGYNIIDKKYLEDIGNTNFYYEGSGGLNEVFFSFSIQLHKNLSVGMKSSYLFGKSNMSRYIIFPDSIYMLNMKIDNYVQVGDMYFEIGAQYEKKLKNDLKLGIGLVYAPTQNIRTTDSYLVRNFFGGYNSVELYRDTIANSIKNRGDLTFPQKYGAGIMLKKSNRWMVAADYEWQDWSNFKVYGMNDSLQNSMRFSLGGEYLPNTNSSTRSYFERVTYRMGIRLSRTYLMMRDTKINEFGISFGFGLPLPRSYSTINLGIEIGRRGTTANDLIQENFVKFTLGIALKERWFIKSKYN